MAGGRGGIPRAPPARRRSRAAPERAAALAARRSDLADRLARRHPRGDAARRKRSPSLRRRRSSHGAHLWRLRTGGRAKPDSQRAPDGRPRGEHRRRPSSLGGGDARARQRRRRLRCRGGGGRPEPTRGHDADAGLALRAERARIERSGAHRRTEGRADRKGGSVDSSRARTRLDRRRLGELGRVLAVGVRRPLSRAPASRR